MNALINFKEPLAHFHRRIQHAQVMSISCLFPPPALVFSGPPHLCGTHLHNMKTKAGYRDKRMWGLQKKCKSTPSPLSLPTLPSPPFTAKGGPMSLHTPPAPLCNSGLKAVVIPSYPPYERNLYNTTQDRYNLLQCAVKPEAMQARSHTKSKNIYTDNISRYNLLS